MNLLGYLTEFEEFEPSTGNPKKFNGEVAPHKPILMLSIIRLYQDNKIDLKKIDPNSKELLTTSEEIWNEWLGYERDFKISYPLYYMKNKEFWHYESKDKEDPPTYPGNVNKKVDFFYLDDDLIDYLDDEDLQDKFILALLRSGKKYKSGKKKRCFSNEDKKILKEKMGLQ